ncbi:MAG: hypothetical protein IT300_04370 [Dehalococcoidia bacterium]|nr:hypothetical protein [Dehalococcoidia bacterium]
MSEVDPDDVVHIRTWLVRDESEPVTDEHQTLRWAAHARLSKRFNRAEIEVATYPWPAAGEPTAMTRDGTRHFEGPLVDRIRAIVRDED